MRPRVAALAQLSALLGHPDELATWAELEEGLADLEAGLDPCIAPALRSLTPREAVGRVAREFLARRETEAESLPSWTPPKQLNRRAELRAIRRAAMDRLCGQRSLGFGYGSLTG
jgi:hypothetical protein